MGAEIDEGLLAFARRGAYCFFYCHGFEVGLKDFDDGIVVFLSNCRLCNEGAGNVLQLLCHMKGCRGAIDDDGTRCVPQNTFDFSVVWVSHKHYLPALLFVAARKSLALYDAWACGVDDGCSEFLQARQCRKWSPVRAYDDDGIL